MPQNSVNKNYSAQMLITIIERTVIGPDAGEEGDGQVFNALNEG